MKVRLGSVLEEFKAKPPAGSNPEVLTLTERNGFVRQSDRFNKRLATEDVSDYKYIELDDFAFNPYLLWAGAIARNGRFANGVISPLYPTFRVRPGNYAGYVERLVLSQQLISAYDNIAFGSVPRRRRSSVKDFLDLEVPALPPLDEQRRIAAVLDKADELRAKRREALAHLDTLTQSIFHSMFGNVPATTTLGELCGNRFRNGVSPSTRGTIEQKVLTLSAVTGSSFDQTAVKSSTFDKPIPESNQVSNKLLLICRGNGNRALVGKGFFPRANISDVGFPDTVIAAEPNMNKVAPLFLEVAWGTPAVRAQLESAAKTTNGTFKINQTSLAAIQLPLPPLELQQTFAARVGAVERLKEMHRKHLAELDALFASLQHRAFKGEL